MSIYEVTERLLTELKKPNNYNFVLVNFPNADMVGHTGNIGPTVAACEAVDECVGKIANYILAYGGYLLVTADHGNAEEMINLHTGQIGTEHTGNPVPFICASKEFIGQAQRLTSGILADVAPTILALLKIDTPDTMTGRDLLGELNN
jgi:2,3-bisphosphoglycerate-independent phosphoglycerate mutase